jgi:hypothetical protein
MLQELKFTTSFKKLLAPRGASLIVSLISLLVIFGWMQEVDFLKRIVPGYVFMNPTTAVTFVLSSIALWLLQSTDNKLIRLLRYAPD